MIDFYIPIFNSTFCAEYQIKTLRAFCKDEFNILLIDNNCGRNPAASADLRQLALKEKVGLWVNNDPQVESLQQVIDNNSDKGASDKLGWTMNLIWRSAIERTGSEYFGILDQDCFAYKPFSLTESLDKNGAYGKVVPTHPTKDHLVPGTILSAWNLHVVVNFFKKEFLLGKDVNFMPGCWGEFYNKAEGNLNLDTGGMNWFGLYRDMNQEDYIIPEQHYLYYDDKTLLDPAGDSPTKTLYEILDHTWIHMVHGATYVPAEGYAQPKTSYIKGFLDHALLMNDTPGALNDGFSAEYLTSKKS